VRAPATPPLPQVALGVATRVDTARLRSSGFGRRRVQPLDAVTRGRQVVQHRLQRPTGELRLRLTNLRSRSIYPFHQIIGPPLLHRLHNPRL